MRKKTESENQGIGFFYKFFTDRLPSSHDNATSVFYNKNCSVSDIYT